MKSTFITLLAVIGVHGIPRPGNLQDFHQHNEPCNHQEGDFKWKTHDFPKFPRIPAEVPKTPFLPPPTFQPFGGQSGFADKKFIPSTGTSFEIPHIPPPSGFPYGPYGPPIGHPYGPPPFFPHGPPPNFHHGSPPRFPIGHPVGPPPLFPGIPPYPPTEVPKYPSKPPTEPNQPDLFPTKPKQPHLPPDAEPETPLTPTVTSAGDNGFTNGPGVNVNSGTDVVPDQNGNTESGGDGVGRTDSVNDASSTSVTELFQENASTSVAFNDGLGDTNQQQPHTTNDGQLSESDIQDIINPRVGMDKQLSSKASKASKKTK